jgi:hypothetical protein
VVAAGQGGVGRHHRGLGGGEEEGHGGSMPSSGGVHDRWIAS